MGDRKSATMEQPLSGPTPSSYRFFKSQLHKYRGLAATHPKLRWGAFLALTVVCIYRCVVHQYYAALYFHSIFLMASLFMRMTPFGVPNVMDMNNSEFNNMLPIRSNQEKAFDAKLPEFEFWEKVTISTILTILATFFSIFKIAVYWPILAIYVVFLFVVFSFKHYKHMKLHNYNPFQGNEKKKSTDARFV